MKENLAINDDISSNPDEVNDHIVQFFTQLFIENEKLAARFGWSSFPLY
jgi:hypothetical protein